MRGNIPGRDRVRVSRSCVRTGSDSDAQHPLFIFVLHFLPLFVTFYFHTSLFTFYFSGFTLSCFSVLMMLLILTEQP